MQEKYTVGDGISRWYKGVTSKQFLLKILCWGSALYLLMFLIVGKSFIAGLIEYIQFIVSIETSPNGEPSPEDISKMFGVMFKWMGSVFLLSLVSWVILAAVETAFHKNSLHGIDHGFFPLRFGVAELRVMLAQFVVYLIINGVYLAAYFAFIILLLIAMGIGSVFHEAAAAILGVIVGIGGILAMIIAIMVAWARLAPAAAMSVRDDEIRLVEGWKLTREMYWPMIGSYLIIMVVGYFFIMLFFFVFAFIAFGDVSVFDPFTGVSEDNPEAVGAALKEFFGNARVLIPLVLGTIVTSFLTFAMYAAIWGVANHAVALDWKKQENPF